MTEKKFSYIESASHPDQTCIGINKGDYAGVIYKYGKVTPIEKDDKLTMQFEYDIIENNAIPREKFNDKFFELIGDILMDILDEKYNTNNTREPNSKWRLC